LPIKLALKVEGGRFKLEHTDVPDINEAKKQWLAGKSAQWIMEEAKRKAKKQKS
jgi:hypothetical protein